MNINVTDKHISTGTRCNPYNCMVAKALQDHDINVLYVDASYSLIDNQKYRNDWQLSEKISNWDLGEIVDPFELKIDHKERRLTVA